MIIKAIHKSPVIWIQVSTKWKAPIVTIRSLNALVLLVAVRNISILPLTTLMDLIKPRSVLLISFNDGSGHGSVDGNGGGYGVGSGGSNDSSGYGSVGGSGGGGLGGKYGPGDSGNSGGWNGGSYGPSANYLRPE